ncbi:hypothetical protein PC116_g18191 [Phytophthora cactorum]|nr:hypothetical protein PC116_g18191 [Phytophthora cactorum]
MGKRKTREPEAPFIQNTELLTRNHEDLDKLHLDLWSTTVKQLKIVKLIRNEIPNCKHSDARNGVHDTSELLNKRIGQVQEILEGSLDHSIQRYKKPPKNSKPRKDARHDNAAKSTSNSKKGKATNKAAKAKNDWKKEATCHKCGLRGHISPDGKADSNTKEVNHYVRGSLYASLEVQAQEYRDAADKKNVAIFVDNGSSLNGISEELAQVLDLEIQEAVDNMMEVDLGLASLFGALDAPRK